MPEILNARKKIKMKDLLKEYGLYVGLGLVVALALAYYFGNVYQPNALVGNNDAKTPVEKQDKKQVKTTVQDSFPAFTPEPKVTPKKDGAKSNANVPAVPVLENPIVKPTQSSPKSKRHNRLEKGSQVTVPSEQ
jgi:Na+/H+-dicarboxylate symporter